MTIALQITLILVLLGVAVGTMHLLYQLGRTAKSLDVFLNTTQKELARIAEDVHASRLRMDQLADSLKPSLDELSVFTRTLGRVSHAVNDFQTKFHGGFESAPQKLGSLLGLLAPVVTFFKRRKQSKREESCE